MKKSTYRVAHILVQHRYEAEDILKKIAEGVSFENLANKYSTCASAKAGGHLGELHFGKADPNFEEAVTELKLQEVSKKPIRTRFGYHLLKRID